MNWIPEGDRLCRPLLTSLAVLISSVGGVGAASAQDDATLREAFKTKQVMDRAIEAYGGEDFLFGLDQVSVQLSGPTSTLWLDENPTPAGSPATVQRYIDLNIQRALGRYSYGSDFDNADINGTLNGSNSNYTFIYTDDTRFLYFPKVKQSTSGFAPPSIRGSAISYVPHLIMAEVAENLPRLTWVGEETVDGRTHDRIYYPAGIGGHRILLFDSQTGYLAGMERPSRDALRGDVVRRVTFSGYHREGDVIVPREVQAGSPYQTFYNFTFDGYDLDADIPESVYAPPPDYEVIENVAFPGRQLRSLTDNVHIFGPTQTMIVEFENDVVVVGLPFDDLATIRETVGDKPIRIGIPTHHHEQHMGAMRAYVNAGVPIMTTSRNRSHYEQFARTSFVLDPDAQSLNPKEPVFEVMDDRRVFDDGHTRLEIINVGPVGHARDMYVAYLPDDGIVFTADLFEFNPEALPPTVADYYRDLAIANFNALKNAGVEATTLVRSHRYTMSMSDLEGLIFGNR